MLGWCGKHYRYNAGLECDAVVYLNEACMEVAIGGIRLIGQEIVATSKGNIP